jgi:hypothetical protein
LSINLTVRDKQGALYRLYLQILPSEVITQMQIGGFHILS